MSTKMLSLMNMSVELGNIKVVRRKSGGLRNTGAGPTQPARWAVNENKPNAGNR